MRRSIYSHRITLKLRRRTGIFVMMRTRPYRPPALERERVPWASEFSVRFSPRVLCCTCLRDVHAHLLCTAYTGDTEIVEHRLAVHRLACIQHASLERARSCCSRSDQLRSTIKQEPHKSQHQDTPLSPSDLETIFVTCL